MKLWNFSLAFLLTAGVFSSSQVFAGKTNRMQVKVKIGKKATDLDAASGTLGGTRFSDKSTYVPMSEWPHKDYPMGDFIECSINAFGPYSLDSYPFGDIHYTPVAPENQYYGACQVWTKDTGNWGCVSRNPHVIEIIKNVSNSSHVTFAKAKNSSECAYIKVDNSSEYIY